MEKRPHRTRYCEVWGEKVGDATLSPDGSGAPAEARLALQLINVYESPDPREIRACYYKNGRLQVRPPHFTAEQWAPVIADAVLDPEWFADTHVAMVLAAACERLGVAAPDLSGAATPTSTRDA